MWRLFCLYFLLASSSFGKAVLFYCGISSLIFEPQRQTAYLWTCAPCEDSDQPAHLRSLIRIFTECFLDSQGCKFCWCGQWSDARKRRLISVFVGYTSQKVRFLLVLMQVQLYIIDRTALISPQLIKYKNYICTNVMKQRWKTISEDVYPGNATITKRSLPEVIVFVLVLDCK